MFLTAEQLKNKSEIEICFIFFIRFCGKFINMTLYFDWVSHRL
jgi:hypothetical protein